MMDDKGEYIIQSDFTIRDALQRLNNIGVASMVLFIADENYKLLGSLTDGDIRRGLLKNVSVNDRVTAVMNHNCTSILRSSLNSKLIKELRNKQLNYVPVLNDDKTISLIINLNEYKEPIPVHAIIMAGGKGERLLPLTKETPKPLLKIGNKPIVEHTIDRLVQFGVRNIHISINYLGHLIEDHFKDGSSKGASINYIREPRALGTIGSVSLIEKFKHDVVLLMNSDLLTNIDFGDFYNEFVQSGGDMAVATVPHHVDLPYAILELDESRVISLQEKPRYTYFANAGIYLIKKELLECLPKGDFYNATDLMEKAIADKKKLINYPILEYWLDIGRMNDYLKAQEDIRHLVL
ncbi:MAG TPA: nucleotidyltransferase family protein [Puia sp.]|nr:nucleotidyltransferase family protein [Puia sp.]